MSKKNEEKTQYHELYAMHTHEGTKQGHKKWKMSARAYFSDIGYDAAQALIHNIPNDGHPPYPARPYTN